MCGNCFKNSSECVYDTTHHQSATGSRSALQEHGIKRRRRTSRSTEDDGLEGFRSLYGRLREEPATSNSHVIKARLEKLMSMMEQLGKNKQHIDPVIRQLLAQGVEVESLPKEQRRAKGQPAISTHASRAASPRRTAESSGDEFPIPSGLATDPVDPVGSLNLGHLSLDDGGKSR